MTETEQSNGEPMLEEYFSSYEDLEVRNKFKIFDRKYIKTGLILDSSIDAKRSTTARSIS